MDETKIRVLVVDDHPMLRMGLRTLIGEAERMQLVGEAASGEAALEFIGTHDVDVVLTDLRMPGMGGIAAIGRIRLVRPDTKMLVLSAYDADDDVYRAIEAGAHGFVVKGEAAATILDAIRAVHRGERFIPAAIAARLADRVFSNGLSAREVEVMEMVAKGFRNKEISSQLFVSENTVKTHLKRIYEKLQASDRTQAALTAVRRGILRAKTT